MKKNSSQALLKEYEKELKEAKNLVSNFALNPDANDDYEASRALLQRLIIKAEDALEPLLNLSIDSEHPRSYEVLCNLLKTIAELSESLIALQKNRHKLNKLDNPEAQQTVTNNTAVFIGATDALQRFIKDQNSKVIDV